MGDDFVIGGLQPPPVFRTGTVDFVVHCTNSLVCMKENYATHLFSYRFNGRKYTIDIPATDENEAKERLKALAWAKYDGELVARVPVAVGPFARIAIAVRNATAAIFR